MFVSSNSIQIVPKMYYKNEHTAIAVANSREELMTWRKSVKLQKPFDQLVVNLVDLYRFLEAVLM